MNTFKVDAHEREVETFEVAAGETWSFTAEGQWIDAWIRCGAAGYRNFLADMLSIRPRYSDAPWLCLVGSVAGDKFRIGKGCVHTFEKSGMLTVYANDDLDRYDNNKGTITLRADKGSFLAGPSAPADGLIGFWQRVCEVYDRTRGILVTALLSLGACAVLTFAPQGRDVVQTAAEDGFSSAPSTLRLVAFAASLLFLAIQTWFWSRTIIDSNYGLKRDQWNPRWLLVWGPRVLGAGTFALVIAALLQAPEPSFAFIVCLVALACIFFAAVIYRQDAFKAIQKRLPARAAVQQPRAGGPGETLTRADGQNGHTSNSDEPPWPFGRWWAVFSFAFSAISMLAVIGAPVAIGTFFGAPAVVFFGVGLIIPVISTVTQVGAAMRLPIPLALLVAAAIFSLWLDNHHVGRRALSFSAGSMAPSGRMDLKTAYEAWKKAQPPGKPLVMTLVASEGGASRAGYWTAEVLGSIHELSKGRLATSLFAINSVSGGSVGAVGYSALLTDLPSREPREVHTLLERFAGRDALSSTLAAMLFSDLFQRFLPISILPDRAEALEGSWEAAWSESCDAAKTKCVDANLLRKPFTSLGPSGSSGWTPLVIVQGASEETGRRILTSRLHLDVRDVDADDFYVLNPSDVPISSAIHNGARFPWISPAGTMSEPSGATGHIVDGGYFDAAGVETIRELEDAIEAIRGADDLHFVVVFIGYEGATKGVQPRSVAAHLDASSRPGPAKEEKRALPEGQGRLTWRFLNEVLTPLVGLYSGRDSHGAHLMRGLKQANSGKIDNPGRATDDAIDPFKGSSYGRRQYVPIILCDAVDPRTDETTTQVPLNWALSQKVQEYMKDATGLRGAPGCGCKEGADFCTKSAIETVARLVEGQ